MARTVIDVNDALLAEAAEILGTTTKVATVNAALEDVRAIEVQALLTAAGNRRALSVADLVIAATAERHGATVLHYDDDYDMIAAVTGQPTEWVVPQGTAD
ncbi:type II toxin-antitoxin system VapB family antitoxin [Kitasatospora sp. NPDC101157]|uniref:type II toxin-antitoxin system VapB family antitoxin n=1 Tax=Kitasatospora sp. NPDC101157 TaxID=3364098 RepID=UPI00380A581B